MDYSSICQAYLSGNSVHTCADNAGNLYGVYNCGIGTTSPSEVVYNTSGIFVNYPTLYCGNRRGIAPDLVAPGALEFNARVEYGLDNCMQGGRSCFTQISTSSGGSGEAWELFWMGSAGQSTGLVTTQSQCTLQPACSDLELEVEGLPLSQDATADEGNDCADRFGFPFGVYTGTIVQSYSNIQIPVELTYNSRGMFVTYPTLNCGNRLPIVPTVTSPSSMEWNERIEYGMDRCALGGRSSFTAVSDNEWELFWVSSAGTAPAGVANIYLRQPVCSNAVVEGNNGVVGGGGGPDEVDQDEEQVEDEEEIGMVDPDMEEEEDDEMVNTDGEEDKNNKNDKDKDDEEDDEEDEEDDEEEDKDKEDENEEEDDEDEEEEEDEDFDLVNAESGVATTLPPTSSTTESICEDESGVAYGTFDGILTQSDNSLTYGVFVKYDDEGVTVDYPAFTCGNVKPLAPVTAEDSLEWTETLDYGVRTCEGGGQVTLTEVTDTLWDFTWVGSGNGNGMVTISGELDFKPLC